MTEVRNMKYYSFIIKKKREDDAMSNFETKANELLEIADKFRDEIKSKLEIEEDEPTSETSETSEISEISEISPFTVGALGLVALNPMLAIMLLASSFGVKKLIRDIQKSPQGNYTTKEISAQTGIEEWKLRRYIASQKLKAESNKSSDGNPGRSGYSVSKNNLIKFIKANKSEIKKETEMKAEIKKSVTINLIDHFLAHIDPVIELGNMEIKLTKLEYPEESKEVIAKEILLQKLKIEKQFFEEQKKSVELATQN